MAKITSIYPIIYFMKKEKIIIIGAGIGGLGAACLLGKQGYKVVLVEKNDKTGGRANIFEEKGFVFDMGPSWYLMPDVFEHFFQLLDEKIEDHFKLIKLAPSYRVFFSGDKEFPVLDMYSDLTKDLETFERLEKGSAEKMRKYLKQSGEQYELAKRQFMYRNYDSIFDFLQKDFMKEGLKMNPFQTMEAYLNKWFADDRLKKILEYTLVFLGSAPDKTPALYNMMNFIDFDMGVYYPEGGIYKVIESLESIARKHGVEIHTQAPAEEIIVEHDHVQGVRLASGEIISADYVISNADMHFTETYLLKEEKHRTFSQKYWNKATMGPSAFILYLGLNGKVETLTHHNLRFSVNWKENFKDVFDNPKFPEDPSYYVCCPTKTDNTIAPQGKDLLFVLVPVAAGLEFTEGQKKQYRDKIIHMMKKDLNIPDLENMIEYESTYTHQEFSRDYNAFQGTALGLAHTLKQTLLRPTNKSKKVKNLLYVGAGTNPGIGMPICLISSELAYKRIRGIKHPHPLTDLDEM
jgi:phytoene desaturase